MANKGSKDNAGSIIIGGLLVVAVIVYYIALTALAMIPIILLIYGIASIFLFRGQKDKSLIQRNFWLTKSEKERFIKFNNAYWFYRNKRDEAWKAVDREGIRMNKDGGISQRSYRGQDLQGAINESEKNMKILTPQLEEIRKIPQKNWKRVGRHFTNRIAMPVALCIGLIVGPLRAEIKRNQAEHGETVASDSVLDKIRSIFDELKSIKYDDMFQNMDPSSLKFWASIGIVSLVAWVICWGIMFTVYSQKYPKPDIVTSNNVCSK
ncbi:MAG: hypothetical protein K2M74_03290 [Bacteroidales bacterium]|nr:hypothetical protein [Bacteroidales bacterium]